MREYLVDALTYAEPKVRSQLALCLRHIAFADYPDKWPSLLPAIGSRISSNDESQLHGGLLALRVLAKIHEYRRERKPVNQIVGDTFPVLLNLLRTVISAPPTVAGAELATLATKIIWSCTQYSLPPQLMDESTLDHFFETLLGVLAQPLPEAGQPQDEDEATAWAPWKVKKRVTQLLQRFISRHGELKKGENGEEAEDRLAKYSEDEKEEERMRARFARVFQDRYSCKCLQGVMELLARSKGGILPGRVKTYCLNYIEEAVKYKSTYINILKPNLEALYSEVIFPALCFNKEDAELWEEDPNEFVRRGFDFVADFFSPKTAAQRLLKTLAEKRAKDCLHGMVVACSSVLQSSLDSTDQAMLMQKDGALLAIGSLAKQLTKKNGQYVASVEPMLRTHVLPALSCPAGFLRQRAIWMYSEFTPSVFSGGKCAPGTPNEAQMTAVFPRLVDMLSDHELPVRVQAALTLKELIGNGCVSEGAVIAVLPHLLERLFNLIREVGADEIVSTLDTLIEHFGENMAPYALQVVSALVMSFNRLVEMDTGNDDDDDGGDNVIAAMSVLQALATMCEAVHNMGETAGALFLQLQQPLLPLFRRCLGDAEGEDYIDDMLEILSYISYHAKPVSPELWQLVPLMHSAFNDWGMEYINQMMGPIDNFITRSPELFLGLENGKYVELVLGMCRLGLIGESHKDVDPNDLHGCPQLLESMLQNCPGRLDAILKDIVALPLMRLEQQPDDPSSMKVLLHNVISTALHYNCRLTLEVLEYRQATQSALGAWFEHLTTCDKLRVRDCKLALLATSAMLALPAAVAPPMISGNRLMLIKLSATLLQKQSKALEKRKEAESDDDDDDDGDDDDTELFGGELGDDDEGEDDSTTAIARLLRSDKRFAGLKFGDDDDDDFDDDELSDDEDHESPIDTIDEVVCLTDATQAACAEDPALLARLGLNAQPNVQVELAAEEVELLRKTLESGVAKKAAGAGAQQ